MRIAICGAGYVGLVTGTGLADLGHDVSVCDIDQAKVDALSEGRVPIFEPGLTELVRRNLRAGRLSFGTELAAEADVYFIAVGTPSAADGSADLSAVMAVTDSISKVARDDSLVVVKSTVPVGTCDTVAARLVVNGRSLEVVSNPEFLKEGDAVNDFFRPDRIVIGARSDRARAVLKELYAPLQLAGERLVMTDPRSSELVKYASNAMLATRISFMNEISRLCHAEGADVHAVRLGVGSDSRIGNRFLYAGPGYGGSCFPKDVQALVAMGRQRGLKMRVAEAAHMANEEQTSFIMRLLVDALGTLQGKKIAIWGLAFKPDTDDIRESPAVKLTSGLLAGGAMVSGHDPEAGDNFAQHFASAKDGGVLDVVTREINALTGAHALVLLTEWRCYRSPDFAAIRRRMQNGSENSMPLVLDARNIWRSADVERAGLRYQGIGVPSAS
jgi:UDPglucose 6-dehydrogenase